jgi:hypothetical protein
MAGDPGSGIGHARRGLDIGRLHGSPDLVAMATQTVGRLTVATGDAGAGGPYLDDAMASAIAGELTPMYAGWAFCEVGPVVGCVPHRPRSDMHRRVLAVRRVRCQPP